ncbi:MAG TPA: potassium-transporting ATPase subunit KdpC [bacterium]|nr:potassium-transporting ATPase subunit KdpC [bacterium]
MVHQWRPAIVVFVALAIVTGLIYPLAITAISQVCFKSQAGGSLIWRDGKIVGSRLIGQPFGDPAYFWGRPSATSLLPYDGAASSGSNLGPDNPALIEAVEGRVKALRAADPENRRPVPVDLVTASASGLDPDISLAAASYQVSRVARARGLAETKVEELVRTHSEGRWLGIFGEPVVSVVELNLALDEMGNK